MGGGGIQRDGTKQAREHNRIPSPEKAVDHHGVFPTGLKTAAIERPMKDDLDAPLTAARDHH
jgi:hypothetical protein